ncbi:hypothetical protein V502_04998 [Pseudogymnoascus sp. VKM F-4520 (FW-2644)]|nr:hypothetical protein V502_04998 [Pseudogymnoascus sp. VKM F-4520 (FW-2644)]
MHFTKILALFVVATAAATAAPVEDLEERTAAPVEDLEERQKSATCRTKSSGYCCIRYAPVNIFFIKGVGQNCQKWKSPCSKGKTHVCCPNNVYNHQGKGDLVCYV